MNESTPRITATTEAVESGSTFKYEKDVCALSWWEPIQLLEEGSIADIHLVKRRDKFLQVRYKEKRNVMALAKRQLLSPLFRRQSQQQQAQQQNQDQLCVLKSIHIDQIGDEWVLRLMRSEIAIMSQLHHPNIVQLVEAYERRRHIYLVLEYCPGGHMQQHHVYEESRVRWVLRHVLSALAYMHQHGIAHRDIKLENIMIDRHGQIKLIDFGLATNYLTGPHSNMTDSVGTLYSMAPEVLKGGFLHKSERTGYNEKCDLWSVGVVAYMLLSGVRPIWGPLKPIPWKQRRILMMEMIERGEYAPMTEERGWGKISQAAKDFVRSLLQLDPNERPTAAEALEAPWLREGAAPEEEEEDNPVDKNERMARIATALTEFRRSARGLLTSKLTEEDVEKLEARLEEVDTSGTGSVPVLVFLQLLRDDIPSLSTQDVELLTKDLEETMLVAGSTDMQEKGDWGLLEYIDFMLDVHVGRERLLSENLSATLDSLDTTGTREVVVDELLPCLATPELRLSDGLQEEIRQKVLALQNHDDKQRGMVSTAAILEWFGERIKERQSDSA